MKDSGKRIKKTSHRHGENACKRTYLFKDYYLKYTKNC